MSKWVAVLEKENTELKTENSSLKHDKFLLEEKVKDLEHRLYGKKSEKIKNNSPGLFNEIELEEDKNKKPEEEIKVETETITYTRAKKRGGRRPLPDHLETVEVIHDLSEEEKQCACGCKMIKIGEEISEKLKYTPAKFEKEKHIRPKYACNRCDGIESEGVHPPVKIADPEPTILPKTIATIGLFTKIITNKFCDGLPFYRQEKIFMRHGIDLTRSMMARWAVMAYENMKEFYDCLHEELLKSYYIGIDETRVQVLNEPDKPPDSRSYMWVYRGVNENRVILIYKYDPSRSGSVPDEFLQGYKGRIQTDGYGGYDFFDVDKDIIHYNCWSHARRKFIEAIVVGSKGGLAEDFINLIRKLYEIEKKLKEVNAKPNRIEAVRINKSLPIVMSIFELTEKNRDDILPGSKLGKAVNYLLNRKDNLKRYINDGHIPIDNNYVENAIRPFVIGRKNWLFFDTVGGAEASAGYYSLIETAKANGIEPYSYMNYVFDKAAYCKEKTDYQKLLPMNIDRSLVKPYILPKSRCG